jgi:LmbE family N-acetylglucosaminyl deacetylase
MRILALSPHTDDAELGAGGTLARYVEEGHRVMVVALSTGNPVDGSNKAEMAAAMAMLGVKQWNIHDFHCRAYQGQRADILQELEQLCTVFQPSLVFCPSLNDTHQDHVTVTHEALRAFRRSGILAYELLRNWITPFAPIHYVKLSTSHIEAKIAALACYQSQQHRPYFAEAITRGLALVRGMQVEAEYAEAFEVLRWVE